MKDEAVSQCIRSWRLTPAPQVRMICLPHAGGSASYFRPWLNALPAEIDLLAIQYPGREDRFCDAPAETLVELSDVIAAALVQYTDRPLVLFGHSLGAALAYEVAIRLEKRGIVPKHVFVSAHPAPHLQRPSNLHRQSDADLLNDIRRLSGQPTTLLDEPELREVYLPIVRQDYRLIETYRQSQPYQLAAAISVVLPCDDSEVNRLEAEGWQMATMQPLQVMTVEGGHFYLAQQYPMLIHSMIQRIFC